MTISIDLYAGTLVEGFLRSAQRFPELPALDIDGVSLSYQELERRATAWAATLSAPADPDAPRLTAVLGRRSEVAFGGILAALLRGHGYVPLHPGFPVERTRDSLIRSRAASVIVDAAGEVVLPGILGDCPRSLEVLLPHRSESADLQRRFPGHRFLTASDVAADRRPAADPPDQDRPAYLLFTSGSTGKPKGVLIAHKSVCHFIRCMRERYPFLTENDRCSQTFDLTFDLSLFDMFVTWDLGACLCCPTEEERIFPTSYIDRAGLTVWFSVPSLAAQIDQLGLLSSGRFPHLTLSLFCGEGLPASVAAAWQRAAPASQVDNLYGPTELTIACTAYTWDASRGPAEASRGLVPIGVPLPGLEALVVDESLRDVAAGQSGELLVAGPQRAIGYLDDPAQTARAFVRVPGRDQVYYRTCDLVRRPATPDQPLLFIGRTDSQVKIRGFRVELGEIEAALREEAARELAAVVPWPITASRADGVVGFVEGQDTGADRLRSRLAARLPPYMQPQAIHFIPKLPLNGNGKIDRKALQALLKEGVRA